jgi:hypothetical protein
VLALSWSGFLPPSIWSFSLCRHLRLSGAAATAAPCARLPLADRLLRCTVFTHSQKTILKQTDVPIPDGVKVTVKARVVVVKGPRGEVKKDLTHLPLDITVTKNEKGQDIVHVERWFTSGNCEHGAHRRTHPADNGRNVRSGTKPCRPQGVVQGHQGLVASLLRRAELALRANGQPPAVGIPQAEEGPRP